MDTFSASAARYWYVIDDLCRALYAGDQSIGLPPYNGGLFDEDRTPLLSRIRLGDKVVADVIDVLSFERTENGRRYINYRDIGVQHLGSIYERLLEYEAVRDGDGVAVRPMIYARKTTGSYYTPDELVGLIIEETIAPIVARRMDAFHAEASRLTELKMRDSTRMAMLAGIDPAERLLDLKICDPAMGSGHFLVNLVDWLSDKIIEAIAESESAYEGYESPLTARIAALRIRMLRHARSKDWATKDAQFDDRNIVRRMVLKRCIYGVDKNPMAVELAKVSLWLHTFTAGAPLSFLNHHLRCGDSLFGSWVRPAFEAAEEQGGLFLAEPLGRATRAAESMQVLEGLTDAEIAEVHRSALIYDEVFEMTSPLNSFLSLFHAMEWLDLREPEDRRAHYRYLEGCFGDPIKIAEGEEPLEVDGEFGECFARLLESAQELVAREKFLNWQVTFPGVWTDWQESGALRGGFDAVIGNPPWDRMKLQQVEWFATRRREIAHAPRASDRRRMIEELERTGDPLAADFAAASQRSAAASRMARRSGDYPLLSRGDLNLYSLFVERAMQLVKADGMVGLLTPSGIASDKAAARFFKRIATEGRLHALFDFENRRSRHGATPFFPDVHNSFKFCAFVASASPQPGPARCAFFLQDVTEIEDRERCFPLTASAFARVNPNTGTAPIFRTRRDAELTTAIYDRVPILFDRSSDCAARNWAVSYYRMFDMTNDSGLFRTRAELEEHENAYPIGDNRFASPAGEWVPLFEGKMVQAFDHRAASIVINPENRHRPAQPSPATEEQRRNTNWTPDPQYWVLAEESGLNGASFLLGFKHVTAATNVRSMIAALIPGVGAGNSFPLLLVKEEDAARKAALLVANLNAVPLDYVVRQKVQGQNLNWFIVEQLPIAPPERYETVRFGEKSAGEIVRESVLELTYTARDMAPFARDMGFVDAEGNAQEPFAWNAERRMNLRAKLDAVYFLLYGITDRDDVRYIFSTFPILEQDDARKYGGYRSRDLCLAWMNALRAGDPNAEVEPLRATETNGSIAP